MNAHTNSLCQTRKISMIFYYKERFPAGSEIPASIKNNHSSWFTFFTGSYHRCTIPVYLNAAVSQRTEKYKNKCYADRQVVLLQNGTFHEWMYQRSPNNWLHFLHHVKDFLLPQTNEGQPSTKLISAWQNGPRQLMDLCARHRHVAGYLPSCTGWTWNSFILNSTHFKIKTSFHIHLDLTPPVLPPLVVCRVKTTFASSRAIAQTHCSLLLLFQTLGALPRGTPPVKVWSAFQRVPFK